MTSKAERLAEAHERLRQAVALRALWNLPETEETVRIVEEQVRAIEAEKEEGK